MHPPIYRKNQFRLKIWPVIVSSYRWGGDQVARQTLATSTAKCGMCFNNCTTSIHKRRSPGPGDTDYGYCVFLAGVDRETLPQLQVFSAKVILQETHPRTAGKAIYHVLWDWIKCLVARGNYATHPITGEAYRAQTPSDLVPVYLPDLINSLRPYTSNAAGFATSIIW